MSTADPRDAATALAEPAPIATMTGADPTAIAAASSESGEHIPVYATSFAPSQDLSFHLKRGLLSGVGTLVWRLDGSSGAAVRYELDLDAKLAGVRLLMQHSQGRVDAAGLAPQRFTDQRLRGSTRAANFQRERGVISFSGSSAEYPLPAGVQDRLSWMVQLPAIVSAEPRLAAPDRQIGLYIIGARGDAALWSFRFVAVETVATAAGEVPALKFIREPLKAHDTQAEVWLDPAQHHLPVRARIGNPPDGDVLDMVRIGP